MEYIEIIRSPQFGEVRIVKDSNGEPLFCLTDVCSVLGLQNSMVMRRLDKGVCTKHPLLTSGGTQMVTFVNEDGLYDVILDSRKPVAKEFRKWITSEVLPSIRRDGGYILASAGDDDAAIMSKALLIAQKTIERQAARLEAQKGDVEFSNAVRGSKDCILIGSLAKLIAQNGVEIGQNRLFQWLRNMGYIGKSGQYRNVANQRFIDMGLFVLEENVIDTDHHSFLTITTKVTGKGQQYFVEGFRNGRFKC